LNFEPWTLNLLIYRNLYELFINLLSHPYTGGRILFLVSEEKNMTNNLSVKSKTQLSEGLIIAKPADLDAFEMNWSWWHAGAAFGMGGGFLGGVVGLVLTMMSWSERNDMAATDINRMATVLIFLTIPMMIFGSYCLDKIETAARIKRIEYCKQNGLPDEECK
jgi:hypothetical protein